jgi:hypothetical protein
MLRFPEYVLCERNEDTTKGGSLPDLRVFFQGFYKINLTHFLNAKVISNDFYGYMVSCDSRAGRENIQAAAAGFRSEAPHDVKRCKDEISNNRTLDQAAGFMRWLCGLFIFAQQSRSRMTSRPNALSHLPTNDFRVG